MQDAADWARRLNLRAHRTNRYWDPFSSERRFRLLSENTLAVLTAGVCVRILTLLLVSHPEFLCWFAILFFGFRRNGA